MNVTQAQFDAIAEILGDELDDTCFDIVEPTPAPAAGHIYRAPNGQRRMLVKVGDGKQAVVNPDTGRLLRHGPEETIFTSWADRIREDRYEFVSTTLACE